MRASSIDAEIISYERSASGEFRSLKAHSLSVIPTCQVWAKDLLITLPLIL
jgi:hypothetical protein